MHAWIRKTQVLTRATADRYTEAPQTLPNSTANRSLDRDVARPISFPPSIRLLCRRLTPFVATLVHTLATS